MVMRLDHSLEEWGYIVRQEYGTVWACLNYFNICMLSELITLNLIFLHLTLALFTLDIL
jgi:hypothetical protein